MDKKAEMDKFVLDDENEEDIEESFWIESGTNKLGVQFERFDFLISLFKLPQPLCLGSMSLEILTRIFQFYFME